MTEERVRALLDVAGLKVGADELASIARDYPTLRGQADAVHRGVTDGALDTSTPTVFPAVADLPPSRPTVPGATIEQTAARLRDGSTTAVQLTAGAFARIDRLDEELGAYVSTFREAALEAAERADQELAAGRDRGPLHGIPVAVKDVLATVEGPTRANSRVVPPGWDGTRDATAVARVRAAGGVVLGKTTTNEFALGLNDPAVGFPMPHNPWDPARYAGGSSSGNAIAIATGMALGGLGSDTAGSVRHPAALTGTTGLKVTRGLVSAAGLMSLAPTLDTVGPMARSAWDCAALLQAIAEPAGSAPVPAYPALLTGSVAGLRIGVAPYFLDEGNVAPVVRARVSEALDVLRAAGAEVVEVDLPHVDLARIATTIVLLCEGLALHRDELAARWSDYGVYVRGLLARGALYGGNDYVQATRIAALFRAEAVAALGDCDVMVAPTMANGARLLQETDPTMMDRWTTAAFTPQWNLAGLPSCAVPVGVDTQGMPVSMQVIGRPFDEATVLRVADAYQRLTDFHLAAPAVPAE
ncbi:MAG: amidase [Nocardioidaceae bacterium]|nr:amidase [Nocardioidaceae bacterium]